MGLVKGINWEKEIPHEEGQKMTFRRLSWAQLEEAAEINKRNTFADIKSMGADAVRALGEMREELKAAKEEQGNTYDKRTVLNAGIVAWTYPENVNPENIGLLDEETAEWAFQEIVNAHKARTEKQRKNS